MSSTDAERSEVAAGLGYVNGTSANNFSSPADELVDALEVHLSSAQRLVAILSERTGDEDSIGLPHWAILSGLADGRTVRLSTLRRTTGLSAAALRSLTEALDQRGLLRVTMETIENRRVRNVTITDEGQDALIATRANFARLMEGFEDQTKLKKRLEVSGKTMQRLTKAVREARTASTK